ncbi:Mediator of RNA polymerase II transcription subunit 18 [Halotydeus destructor]|nr:Mediator of RNA polymerase II transcription subunit 18 [Halotydeus destructor]
METPLATARRGTSTQEYLLQGSIVNDSCEVLLQRLRGLCDNADSPLETFHDHERVYSLRSASGQLMTLRVRRDVENKELPWHCRYLGQPEVGDKNRATLVRSCIDVACSNNISQFLVDMGFKLDYEFLSKGYMFKKGRMKVIVAKIFRMPNNPSEGPESVSPSYLVELSVVAPSGQDTLAEEMKSFSEQLKPLVNLDKVDHRRIVTA